MNYNEQAIKVLTEQMEKVAEQQISSAPFDQTYTFTVKKCWGNNKYTVTCSGMELDIVTDNELNLKIMDKVHIIFQRGDINNRIILEDIGKAVITKLVSDVVTSVNGKTGDVIIDIPDNIDVLNKFTDNDGDIYYDNQKLSVDDSIEYREFGKCLFRYEGYDVADTIEESAKVLSTYDLIVGGGALHSWTESDERNRQYQIVEKTRELNPNIKLFWYIGLASTRTGAEVGDNGMWDPGSEDVPILSKQEIMQEVEKGLHVGGYATTTQDKDGIYLYAGGMKFDGIFWDEFGMDTEEAVKAQGFESIQQKKEFVVDFARKRYLCSFVNGWDSSCYSVLTPEDYFCLESNETRCSFENDELAYWMNESTSSRLYDYYKNYYQTVGAKMVALSYIRDNNTQEECERIMTWCIYNTLVQGGHYVALSGARPISWEMPENVNLFRIPKGEEYNTVKEKKGVYSITVNGHTLRTRRQISGEELGGGRVCNMTTLKNVFIDIDEHTIQNDFLTAPIYAYEQTPWINKVDEELELIKSPDKTIANVYHRMMIDDWEKQLEFTNLITTDWINNWAISDSNYFVTLKDEESRGFSITSLQDYSSQHASTLAINKSLAGHTLEIGVLINSLSGTFGCSYLPSESYWKNFSANASTISQVNKNLHGDVIWVKIPEDIEDDVILNFYYNTDTSGQTINVSNLWIYDINEHDIDITKGWYTNLSPKIFNYTDNTDIINYNVIQNGDYSFDLQYNDSITDINTSWAGIRLSIVPSSIFKPGNTYEIGCETFDTNCGQNIAFRMYADGLDELWFPNTNIATSLVYGDKRPCKQFTIPSTAIIGSLGAITLVDISEKSYDVVGEENIPHYCSIKNFYIYDVNEDNIVKRGIDPSNSFMRICRVTNEKLLDDKNENKLLEDSLYINDNGSLYMTDFQKKISVVAEKNKINSLKLNNSELDIDENGGVNIDFQQENIDIDFSNYFN